MLRQLYRGVPPVLLLLMASGAQAAPDRKHEAALAAAEQGANFILRKLRQDGRLHRTFNNGKARHAAYLDDYAFLIAGLLELYETTFEIDRLATAIELQAVQDEFYADEVGGGYFFTGDDHESLLAREKPSRDGAEPSGNSVALMNLLRLH